MAIYKIVTIGGVDYNSFEDLATADIYLAADPNADAFRAGDDDAKGRWLVTATRTLARQNWQDGVIADPLPQEIRDATVELANAIAGGFDAANSETTASGIKRQSAGSVEQEFFHPGSLGMAHGHRFPLSVWELIRGLLAGSGASGIGSSLASGTCGQTIADIDYGYSGGYGDGDGYRRSGC